MILIFLCEWFDFFSCLCCCYLLLTDTMKFSCNKCCQWLLDEYVLTPECLAEWKKCHHWLEEKEICPHTRGEFEAQCGTGCGLCETWANTWWESEVRTLSLVNQWVLLRLITRSVCPGAGVLSGVCVGGPFRSVSGVTYRSVSRITYRCVSGVAYRSRDDSDTAFCITESPPQHGWQLMTACRWPTRLSPPGSSTGLSDSQKSFLLVQPWAGQGKHSESGEFRELVGAFELFTSWILMHCPAGWNVFLPL